MTIHGKWIWEYLEGEKEEAVTDFIFLGSKITVDSDCSHEIKGRLLLGMKAITNLDSILKSREITLPTKVHIVKTMVFPVVMYRCESWTIKQTECWRIDAFGLWCWRRLLRIPLLVRRWNQSILKKSTLNIHWKDSHQAEAAMIWPLDMKSKLIGKDPGAGKVQKQQKKRVEEDEMVR